MSAHLRRGVQSYARGRYPRSMSSAPPSARGDIVSEGALDWDDARSTRSITRLTTSRRPRIAASTTTGPLRDQQSICALTEARGISPTVGLAFVNLSTAAAVLCQIADNQTYVKTLHKLTVFDPSEILFTSFAGSSQSSKLLQVLEGNLSSGAPVRTVHRKNWNESAGLKFVQDLAFVEDVEAIKVSLGGNSYATCCFAAAMTYIASTLNISFALNSMRIKYEPSEGAMMIDVATIQALELIQNAQQPRSRGCLFGLLNHTVTKMGARLLRSSILQPLVDQEIIEKRLDAVDVLTNQADVFVATRQALKTFQDVDRTLTSFVIIEQQPSISQWEQSINNILALKQYLHAVPPIYYALQGAPSELLLSIRQFCAPENLGAVTRLIGEVINEDVTYETKPLQLRNQRVYAVKAGVNGLLDIARQTYKEASHDAYQLLLDLQQTHELSLEMKYDTSRQSYFVIKLGNLNHRNLPDVFINRFRKKNWIECQTLELMKLNQKILDSSNEAMHLSEGLVQQLIEDVRAAISPLFRISDGIAVLDMLLAFAEVSMNRNYTRPKFSSVFAIKNGRHPIAEQLCTEKFVSNDVYASGSKRLHIVTGCNMSGKSTYIRAIALMTIMGQMGCFVPAECAAFQVRQQLFARVSVDDNATSNVSTFASEMRETAFILRNITPQSLVIVDELGRGTSTRDGLAIAVAVVEALVQSHAFIWFVTHFHDLPKILSEREGISSLHLRTERPDANSLAMLYEVADGQVKEPHYGLALAKAVGLPDGALAVATKVAHQLETRATNRRKHPPIIVLQARRRRLVLGLHEQLLQAKNGNLEGEELRQWMKSLQDEFVLRTSKIDDDERLAKSSYSTYLPPPQIRARKIESSENNGGRSFSELASASQAVIAPLSNQSRIPSHDIRAYCVSRAKDSPLPFSNQLREVHMEMKRSISPAKDRNPADAPHQGIASSIASKLAAEFRQPVDHSSRALATMAGTMERPMTVSSAASSTTMTGYEDEEEEEVDDELFGFRSRPLRLGGDDEEIRGDIESGWGDMLIEEWCESME